MASCYTGADGTQGVALCKAGTTVCADDGFSWGPCQGQVVPSPETCNTAVDDDCDGETNEEGPGCLCRPNEVAPCYTGASGTLNVGICRAGTKMCNAMGTAFGACTGQVTPTTENCTTPEDENCSGQANEPAAGCLCQPGSTTSCYSGASGTQNVGICRAGTKTCNDTGTGYGACLGQVTPTTETCNTPDDDDCDGQTNESGAGCVCTPNATVSCYSGMSNTLNVGNCRAGTQTCNAQGTALGPCVGEVTPSTESCNAPGDEDCDGQFNESGAGCVCLPGSTQSCYSGAAGTVGVGLCRAGSRTCNAQGTGFGACTGEVTPALQESCTTAGDDDCNGQANEGCPSPPSYAADVRPFLEQKCAPCHTAFGNGGFNVTSYAETQLASGVCAGKTKGACMLERVQNGSMPQFADCANNPGNPACLTAAEQQALQAWITGGQRP